jgi:hypothetical protein
VKSAPPSISKTEETSFARSMIDYVQIQYLSYRKVTQQKFGVVESYKVTHLHGLLREIIG